MGIPAGTGIEWILDACGCDPAPLRDRARLDRLFRRLVADLHLHGIGAPIWHRFPRTRGLTGAWILSESHLTCHTFPEHGGFCLNLYTCRPRPAPDWSASLAFLGPEARLRVRRVRRRYALRRSQAPC